jgi:hypothetical protein
MNYEKHLLAIVKLGESGNSIIVTRQSKKQVEGIKLFPGGNKNIKIPKKAFKQMLSNGVLEVIECLPSNIYAEFYNTWHRQNTENSKTNCAE